MKELIYYNIYQEGAKHPPFFAQDVNVRH